MSKLSALLGETRQYVDSLIAGPEEVRDNVAQSIVKPSLSSQTDETRDSELSYHPTIQELAAFRKIADPSERLAVVTEAEVRVETALSQLAIIREWAVLEMQKSGLSLRAIADRAGFSRGRAQALLTRAKARKSSSQTLPFLDGRLG